MDSIQNRSSEPTVEQPERLSRRQRAMLLCHHNREWLQYQIEHMLHDVPMPIATPLLFILKRQAGISRPTLHLLPSYLLSRMSDEGFDRLWETVMQLLADL